MNEQERVEKIKKIQTILEVEPDGKFGKISQGALDKLKIPIKEKGVFVYGKASSFADPADIKAFIRCKKMGGTDRECFKVGDNGVGCWGDDTNVDVPMCAVSASHMQKKTGSTAINPKQARGLQIIVFANGGNVICELRDRLPNNSPNGAVIDLNPSAAKVLGLKPPFLVDAKWAWMDEWTNS